MSFKMKGLNHSPAWYYDNCRAEDGGYPVFRKMLTNDMKFVAADIDKKMTYEERIGPYEEAWNEILSGGKGNASPADLAEVMERELADGYRPTEHYAKEPFASIARLMDDHKLSTTEVGVFLSWRAKIATAKNARDKKPKPVKKPEPVTKLDQFLERKKPVSFLDSDL